MREVTAFIHDNIEFVMPTVFKATMRDWAEDLIQDGTIYFTNIQRFIDDSDPQRRDQNEGRHVVVRNGVRCTAEYPMPVYVWCCSMDTRPCRTIETWSDKDCVIQVLDTIEFAKRITSAVGKQHPKLWPLHLGPVVYTKTAGGRERTDWADGIFQKDERYDGQKEFRFALTGATGDQSEEHIALTLGPCRDIVRIALIMNPEHMGSPDR